MEARTLTADELVLPLLEAYCQARRHKRNTVNQLQFELNMERSIYDLSRELSSRAYNLKPSICFINEEPVKREIIAANFRDRVVHHLLCNWICPIFDKLFIHDCYSCRVGKGTDFAIGRAKHFLKSESRNYARECWALRLDISGFFMGINRDILYKRCIEGLRRGKWKGVPDKDLCVFLLKKFIYNNPLENAIYRSPPKAWDDLPLNKTLRGTAPNCGLPIGNLTSQWFGNIYLNKLDQFIKHRLKIRCYGRYVDDMLLIHHDKQVLLNAIPRIREYLWNNLHLHLNEKKTRLQPARHGFSMVGAYILPYRTYPGRRTVKNFRECVTNPCQDEERQKNRVLSYLGYMGHYDAFRLTKNIMQGKTYENL